MRSQFIGYAADIIECRIKDLQLSTPVQPRFAARMLAATLIESMNWWLDHASKSMPLFICRPDRWWPAAGSEG
ncbi:MAG: hypothetical protein ACR2NS_12065 [Gemmatimonadaceae bacterium]